MSLASPLLVALQEKAAQFVQSVLAVQSDTRSIPLQPCPGLRAQLRCLHPDVPNLRETGYMAKNSKRTRFFRFADANVVQPKRVRSRALNLEALDPRILLDASGILTPSFLQGADLQIEPVEAPDGNQQVGSTQARAATHRHEIVFVDAGVERNDVLLADLRISRPGLFREVVMLDAHTNGLDQIAKTLADRNEIDAVHIISHGNEARLHLGNATIGGDQLSVDYRQQLATIGKGLSQEGDILIYGCDLAGDASGREFVQTLGQLTGADVAASDDVTGHTSLGGDWELEVAVGRIEASLPFGQQALERFDNALQLVGFSAIVASDGTPSFDADDIPGNDSGPNNGIIRSHDIVTFNVDFSTDSGGATNPTIKATLPDGLVWDVLPAVGTGANSGIFDSTTGAPGGDMRTIVIHMPDIGSALSTSIPVQARALGYQDGTPLNGIQFEMCADELAAPLESAEMDLEISSAPFMDIMLEAPVFRGVHNNPSTGKDGAVYSYTLGILGQHPTRSGTDSFKGSAPIEDPFTFDIDLSNVSDSAEVFTWGPSIGQHQASDGINRNYERGPNGSGGVQTMWSRSNRPVGRAEEHTTATWEAARSTPDSGDATLGAGTPGGTYPVTVVGADTDGPLPTRYANNGIIPAGQGWFASYQVHVWIPICDIDLGDDGIAGTDDDGVLQVAPAVTNFDPDDFWNDQNNYGLGVEDPDNNDHVHTVVSNSIGGPTKRLFESGVWRWVNTSSNWSAGDGVTSTGHQYDASVLSGRNAGVLPQPGVIWGDKFDTTSTKIVPIADYAGSNRSNHMWSRAYASGGPFSATWLQYGTDYTIEFGTGGVGGAAGGWTDWNSMGDATLADSESPTWWLDPTDPGIGGTYDPDTGVADSISKWRVKLLRDLEPGETVYSWVTYETTGHSTLDLAADPTGDTIADTIAATSDYRQASATLDEWITSEFNPLDNGWFPEGTSSDVFRGDRLRFVEAQVRVDKQVVDTGTGGNFLAGSTATFTIDPTVTIPGPDDSAPAEDVVVTDILPAGLTIVAGSLTPTSAQGNPVEYCIVCDGSDWTPFYPTSGLATGFRFNYGDVPLNTALPQIQFEVLVPFDAPNGQNYENTAVIESPSDPSEEEWRDSQAGITAVQVAALSVNKVPITPLVPEDTLMIYELGVANVSDDKDIPFIDTIDLLPWSGDEDGSSFSGNFTNINITGLDPSLEVYVTNQSPTVLDNQDSLPGDGFADAGVDGVHAWFDAVGDPAGDWQYLLSDVVAGTASFGMSDITAVRVLSDGSVNPQLPAATSTKWRLELTPSGNVGIPSDKYVNDISVRTDPVALAEPTFSGPATITVVAPDVDIQKDVCINEFGPCDAADDSHWVDNATYTDDPDPTWRIRVENTGTSDLVDVTVTDPMMPTGMSIVGSTVSATVGDFSGFDPTWTLSLVPGDVQYLTFDTSLDVVPDTTSFENQVSVAAQDQFGQMVGDADDATVTYTPEIGVSKQQVSAIQNVSNPAIYDVTYSVTVENTGLVVLDDIMISEDLHAAFGPGFVGLGATPPTIVSSSLSPGASLPLTNVAWNGNLNGAGDAQLLDGMSGILSGGDRFTIEYVIQVDPLLLPDPANETNQVLASSNGGEAMDLSDDGNDPDGPNPGAPGDMGTTDDPTPLRLPLINLEKEIVGTPTPAVSGVDGNYDVTYEFTVENTGTTDLTDISLTEDFLASMGGAFVGVVNGPIVTNTTATDNPDFNLPAYDGGLSNADVFVTAPTTSTFEFGGSTTQSFLGKQTVLSDQSYQIDPNQEYMLMVDASADDGAGGAPDPDSRHYLGFASYDIDGNFISMYNYSKFAGSMDTTLAAPLNPGDLTITLTDATGWSDGTTTHRRSIAWYGYTDSTGFTYPDYGYTRNFVSDAWDAGAISGNTITLRDPWSGPAIPAGDAVRNTNSGGSYQYVLLSNGHIDLAGDTYATNIGGSEILDGVGGTTLWRPGTHSIRALSLADFANDGVQLNLTDFKITAPNMSLLEPEQTVTFQITVEIDPNAPGAIYDGLTGDGNGDLENQASVTGTDTINGNMVSDLSDDPTDPTDDNPDGDGDPDDPTALILSDIGIAKQVVGTPSQLANDNWSVEYQIVVENTGAGNLANIQVTEDLEIEFGSGVFAGIIASPTITGSSSLPGSSDPILDGSWDGGLNGSGNNTMFNGSSGLLVPGDTITVRFTVEVDPDASGTSNPLDNQAVATAMDGNGETVTDDSDSGADPVGDNPGEPGDMMTSDDPTPLSFGDIGVAKQINTVTEFASGIYDVEYVVVVENTGTVDLDNLQLTEDLAAEFGNAFASVQTAVAITSTSLAAGSSAPNLASPIWDGSTNTEFFDGTSGLFAPGDSVTLTFTVRIDTNMGDTTPPNDFSNQVEASGDDPNGGTVTDESDDGTNPNNDNGSGGTDDPTPLRVPQIRSHKCYGTAVANPDGSYTIPVSIRVGNAGTVDLTNLSLIDNVGAQFGAGLISVSGATIVAVGSYSGVIPTVNPAWTGLTNADIINPAQANETLPTGEEFELQFTVVVDPDAVDGMSMMMDNQAHVEADGENFDTTIVRVMDDSASGCSYTNPDGTDNDQPSPLLIPEIRTTKAVANVVQVGNDYQVTYAITVENTGTVDLDGLDLVDDLSSQLGPALLSVDGMTIDTIGIGTGTAPTLNFGGTASVTPYDGGLGAGSTNMLNNDGTLAPGEFYTVNITITLDPEAATSNTFENQATAAGDDPSGMEVMDPSDSGTDPNSNNLGEPNDTGGHDDPTPLEIPDISVTKEVFGTPTELANGNFSVTYRLVLQNSGTIDLINLQMVENLESEFGTGYYQGVVTPPAIVAGPNEVGSNPPNMNGFWDGGLGGSANTGIFVSSATSRLKPGDTITVQFAVEVDPDFNGTSMALDNQVEASGTGVDSDDNPIGNVTDDSDSGTDPNSDNPGEPGDMMTSDDPTPLSIPSISTVKRVAGDYVNNGDGTYTIPYELVLENTGTTVLNSPTLVDNIQAQLGATVFVSAGNAMVNALSVTGTPPTLNPAWDGTDASSLLIGGSLNPADEVVVTIEVTVNGSALAANSPLTNQATAGAADADGGGMVMDLSDDGDDVHGDNAAFPGDDGMGGTDDPTPIQIPDIGLAKAIVGAPTQLTNGNWSVVYELVLQNVGTVDLTNLQITEDLEMEFGAGVFVGVLSAPMVTAGPSDPSSVAPTMATWTGGLAGSAATSIFNGTSGLLQPNDSITVRFTVEVDPDVSGTSTPLDNTAQTSADALDEDGNPLMDSLGTPISVMDDSDSGTDPNSDNPTDPGDMGTSNDPTPLAIPEISTVKRVSGDYVDNGDGTYTIPYELVTENIGSALLNAITLVDNIQSQLGPAVFSSAGNVVIDATGITAGTAPTINTLWDGTDNSSIINGGSLEPGDFFVVTLDVVVQGNALSANSPLTNQTTAGANVNGGGMVSDLSDDGDDVHGDNPDAPGDTGTGNTDDPTPIQIADVALAKAVVGTPTQLTNGNWLVVYELNLQNVGTVDLTNLQITEDLETEFGVGIFVGINSAPTVVAGPSLAGSIAPSMAAAWNGGLAGSPNINILSGSNGLLKPNDVVTIQFTAEVDPDFTGTSVPLDNTAQTTADALDEDGNLLTNSTGGPIMVMDDSDSGTDPNSDNFGAPGDLGTPDDPTPLRLPEISAVKQVSGDYVFNGDGTVSIPFAMNIENIGTVALSSPVWTDDIASQLGATVFVNVSNVSLDVTGVVGGTAPGLNGAWAGTDMSNILDGTGTLATGDSVSVTFEVVVNLQELAENSPLTNQATVSATDPDSNVVMDLSDDGDDVHGDNPSSPGDSGVGNTDDPTPILVADIGLAKQVVGTPTQLANGNWSVVYELVVENIGSIDLQNVQVTEDLEIEFGAGVFVGVLNPPLITSGPNDPGSTAPTLDASWDGGLSASGNSGMFDGTSGHLEPNDMLTVRFTVEVNPDATGDAAPLNNQADAYGEAVDSDGNPFTDSMGNPISVTDASDDGADAEGSNAGSPGDMGTTDDPTPLEIPEIGVAKQVNQVTATGVAGEFDVQYVVIVENTGTVDLENVQVVESLTAELGAGFVGVQSGVAITSTNLSAGSVAPNLASTPTWDGTAVGANFFDGASGLLAPGDSLTLNFTIRINALAGDTTAPNDWTNQVVATGDGITSNGNIPVMDLSDDGTNPNTDNGEGTSDDPTELFSPQVRAVKTYGVITANADGTYTVPVTIGVQNTGLADMINLSLTEDIASEFGNAFISVSNPQIAAVGPFTGVLPSVNPAWTGDTSRDVIEPTQTTERLPIGEQFEFTFDVVVDPDAVDDQSQPLMNQASISGDGVNFDGSTVSVSDESGHPTATDADGNDLDNPAELLIPEVRTTKVVAGVVPNGENWDVMFDIRLENTGSTDLTGIDLFDNLATQLGSQFVSVVNVSIDNTTGIGTGPAPTLNFGATAGANPFDGGLSGIGSDNLLNDDGTMAPGEFLVVTLTITVDPDATGTSMGIENQATGFGDDPNSGAEVSDPSDDGTNPNTSNAGSPNDTGGHDDPTPVNLPDVAVAKNVVGSPVVQPNGNFLVTYRLVMENIGTVDLDNLQITEDIDSHFGAGILVGITSPPTITVGPADPGSATPGLVAWDGGLAGSVNMFDGTSGRLVPGDSMIVEFIIEIDPDANGPAGTLHNQVEVFGDDPGGNTVSDLSDDGNDPNTGNPGEDGDMGTYDDPTPLTAPGVNVAKQTFGPPLQVAPGSDHYHVTYQLVLENTGNVALDGLDLFDDVANEFGGAFVAIPSNPTIVANTLADPANLPTINAGWLSNTSLSMFNDDGNMAPGETITVQFIVTVDAVAADGMTLLNQAQLTADDPVTGGEDGPTDLSDDGTDPKAPNTGSPGDLGTYDDPTPVVLPDATIGLAKGVAAVDGTTVTLNFAMENLGNVTANAVSLTDDLDATFGAGNYIVDSIALSVAPTDSGSSLTVNGGFNGSGDQTLLDGTATNRLIVGDTAVVTIEVTVTNFVDMDGAGPMEIGEYVNNATVTSADDNGNSYMDESTDGTDPDPNGDDDPVENTPTPINIPTIATIGAAKESIWDDSNDSAVFSFFLEHLGTVEALNISLIEDLDAVLGAGNYTVSAPVLVSGPATINVDTAFDGSANTELVAAGSTLQPGETAQIQIAVNVLQIADPQSSGLGTFINQVTVTSENFDGEVFMDLSTDGIDPDPDMDGDPTNNDVPSNGYLTPDATVGIAKSATLSQDNNTIVFLFSFENFGNTQATNIMAFDDLAGVFGAGTYSVLGVTRPTGPASFAANGMFDGSGDQNLVSPNSSLMPDEVATIEVTVDITNVTDGTFQNYASVINTDNGGTTYEDQSTDGIDPDTPNMNEDPTDDDGPTEFIVHRGEVHGTVYADFNNNGVQDAGEPGIPNVEIHLAGVAMGSPIDLVAYTDGDGEYWFVGLWPGDYVLTEVHPEAFIDGIDSAGSEGGSVSNDTIAFSLSAGDTVATDYDFGERGLDPLYQGKDPFIASGGSTGGVPGAPGGDTESDVEPYFVDGNRVTVYGTSGDDTFVIRAGLVEHTIQIDFVAYSFDASQITEIELGSGSGDDQVTIVGSSADDLIDLQPKRGTVTTDHYQIRVNNVEQIRVDGGAGVDRATMTGSNQDDTFRARPNAGTLTGPGFALEVEGVRSIDAFALDGNDRAYLHDSDRDDEFTGKEAWARLRAPGYHNMAYSFDTVQAYSEAGGYDRAILHDSSGDDRFVGRPMHATLRAADNSFSNRATGFDRVNAYATTGHDVAHLHDSGRDDRFVARPGNAVLRGENDVFYNKVNQFDQVFASASGGHDTATFHGSGAREQFVATPDYAVMREVGNAFQNQAAGFDVVSAYGSAGNDDAVLRGSEGDDVFTTRREYTSMISRDGAVQSMLVGFDSAVVEAQGGEDRAYVREVGNSEMVYGREAMIQISSPQRDVEIRGIESAMAYSLGNEIANSDIENVDYLFASFGQWS